MFWTNEFIRILLLNVIQTCHWIAHFVVAKGLCASNDPEGCASDSIVTSRASHTREVKGEKPD